MDGRVFRRAYLADHWCDHGHLLYVLKGELDSELRDGRKFKLTIKRREGGQFAPQNRKPARHAERRVVP